MNNIFIFILSLDLNVQKEMAELVHEFKNMYPDISENDQPSTAKKAKRSKRTS